MQITLKPDTTSSQSDAVDAMERCISAIRCWMIKKVDMKGLVVGDATS